MPRQPRIKETKARKFIGKGDTVQHTAGWTGKVIKLLGDGAFGVRVSTGEYYACHDLNLTVIKESA